VIVKTGEKCKELKNRSRKMGIGILQKAEIKNIYRKYININGRQTKVSGRRRRGSWKLVRSVKRFFSFPPSSKKKKMQH